MAPMVGLNSIRELLRKAFTVGAAASGSQSSYVDYTSVARVEPIVLIDYDVSEDKALIDILYSLQSIFTAFYLQAFALSSHNINGVSVIKTLDKLNPSRDPMGAFMAMEGLSLEDFKFALPGSAAKAPALESDVIKTQPKDITEASNLAVGKMITVSFKDGDGHDASLPISVRLITQIVRSDTLKYVMTEGKTDTSFMARWDGYKSGRLKFINDMILCNDLVDAHRKRLLKDPEGVFSNILTKRRNHVMAGIVSNNLSVAAASNMLVMSDTTAAKIENELNGSLKDMKIRKQIFDDSSLMILVVLEKEWSRVRIYYRGLTDFTQISVSALAAAGKSKNGMDTMEIYKALSAGQAFMG